MRDERRRTSSARATVDDVPGSVHPIVASAFRALDRAGIEWALIRGADDLLVPRGDVDLLVHEDAGPQLDKVFARAGLLRLGVRGHGAHRFYFSYDESQDLWIKLDVVTAVEFGRYQQLRSPLGSPCLQRRRRVDGVWRLAPEDEAWLLLLHLLLDKGQIPSERRHEAELATSRVRASDAVGTYLESRVAGSAHGLVDVLSRGDDSEISGLSVAMTRAWARRGLPGTAWRWLTNRVARRLAIPVGAQPKGLVAAVVEPAGRPVLPLPEIKARFPMRPRTVEMGDGANSARTAAVLRAGIRARYHVSRGRLVLLRWPAHGLPRGEGEDASPGLGPVRRRLFTFFARPGLLLVVQEPGEARTAWTAEHLARAVAGRLKGPRSSVVLLDGKEAGPEFTRRRSVTAILSALRRDEGSGVQTR